MSSTKLSRVRGSGITAVTLSETDMSGNWMLKDIPIYCHTAGYDPKYNARKEQRDLRERIDYLTQRRNEANAVALRLFPETKNILAIDSYYLCFDKQIKALIDRYLSISSSGDCIVGSSTWATAKVRLFRNPIWFYDYWSTPEMEGFRVLSKKKMPEGIRKVSSVGACYIYPRWAWEKHGYAIPEPFPDAGIFHNWLCQKSGLPVYLDFDVQLWRTHATNSDIPEYSLPKRLRISLHLGRTALWRNNDKCRNN